MKAINSSDGSTKKGHRLGWAILERIIDTAAFQVSYHHFSTMANMHAFDAQRHAFKALQQTFVVDQDYSFHKELGQGAYGLVVAAKNRRTGEGCAIKKITNIGTKVRWPPYAMPPHRRRLTVAYTIFAENLDQEVSQRNQVSSRI